VAVPELSVLREQALVAFATDETYAVLMCRMATTILQKRRSTRARRKPDRVDQDAVSFPEVRRIKTP
jgi:hypothetical protein